MKRARLIISGDVVGVGFRAWAKGKANTFGITGWVRNRQDDTVEIVAEGNDLEKFVNECRRGPDIAWVERVDVTWQKATGEFPAFSVVY